jgi:hypothetical protein
LTALTFLMAPVLFAIYVLIAAALLAVPFVAAAGAVAFLHRAVLLMWFDRAKPSDGTGQAA